MSVIDALSDFIRAQHPYALCTPCLAKKLHLSENDAWEALLVVLLQPSFGLRRRICYGCAHADEVVEFVMGTQPPPSASP